MYIYNVSGVYFIRVNSSLSLCSGIQKDLGWEVTVYTRLPVWGAAVDRPPASQGSTDAVCEAPSPVTWRACAA